MPPGAVAVIVPCFNSGDSLAETVGSVLRQRRPAQEIVVVDDGSDDPRTLAALERLPSAVRVLRQSRGGVARARDAGVRATRSGYLLWLDADDLLAPDYLEVTAAALDGRPDLDIVATAFEAFGAESFRWTPPDPACLERHFADGTFLVTALFRRSLWEARGGADPALAVLEDWDYWVGALAAGHRAVVVDRPLVCVRATPGSRRLRGLEGDRIAPALERIVARHRHTLVGLGQRLHDAKAAVLADLARRREELLAELARRRAALGPRAGTEPQAVVLMYHRAAALEPDPFHLCVPPALLARHLDAIAREFHPVGVTELLDALAEGALAPRSVAVTFDDGYRDALVAADLLAERGLPAMFFVNTFGLHGNEESWETLLEQILLGSAPLPRALSLSVGGSSLALACGDEAGRRAAFEALHTLGWALDADGRASLISALAAWTGREPAARESHRVLGGAEVRALAARKGMEIGVHGVAHLALPLHPPAVQEQELAGAKSALESLLGRPVSHLAYAYGAHDARTVGIAARLAFRSAFTVRESALRPWDDPLTLPRIDVGACEPDALVARVRGLLGVP